MPCILRPRPVAPRPARPAWRRRLIAPSIALALAIALLTSAACGSTEAPDPTAPPASATALPEVSPAVIPPLGFSTPAANIPEGMPNWTLALGEGPALVVRSIEGVRSEVVGLPPGGGTTAFPVWSPDGETIAFVVRAFFAADPNTDWGDDIYVVPADGGEARLVREHTEKGAQVFGLAWRPDGGRLLFGRIDVGLRSGVPYGIEGAAVVELDLASGAERTVIEGGYDPSLSSDGSRLAYLELGDLPTETTVMVAGGDGESPVPLARSSDFEVLRFPRISPDGTRVVITAAERLSFGRQAPSSGIRGWIDAILGPFAPRRAEAHGIPMDLWLVDSTSAELTRLTAIGEDDPYPAWSPDGGTVVFVATNGLYEASVDGDDLVRTGGGWFDGQLAVAPE